MMKSNLKLIIHYLFLGSLVCGGYSKTKPQKPKPNKPNVLFIGIDDLNDWAGYLDSNIQARTPNIDQLARSGVAFTHAYAPAPVCGPSRTALLYGQSPWKTGAYGNNRFYSPYLLSHKVRHTTIIPSFWEKDPTSLPKAFRASGYYTAGAGKLSHFTQTPRFNSDVASFFKDDYDAYYDSPTPRVRPDPENQMTINVRYFNNGPVALEDADRLHDTQYSDWAIKQLQKDYEKPFFLSIGFRKPHMPWVAPKSYFKKFKLSETPIPNVPDDVLEDIPKAGKIFAQSRFFYWTMYPKSEHQTVVENNIWKKNVRAYLASINYADAMVGKVLDALKKSPYADNTIVVLWGDHGWHLGEKKHWQKMTLWETGTRTPLIIRMPSGNAANGETIDAPVSLQDLYPTLMDLLKLDVDQRLDGNSLVPLLKDPDRAWDKPVVMGHGPGNFAVRTDRWRYISYQNGDQELYDMQEDPEEYNNLAASRGHQQVIDSLSQYIPRDYVTLYDPWSIQFSNLDTMTVFQK